MANRYLRGTFTRNAWDFYEVGCAFLFGNYEAPGAGGVGFIFNNNGIAQSYLDLFRVEVSSTIPSVIVYSVVSPGAPHDSIEPALYYNLPVQLDLGRPPGDMSIFTTPSWFTPVVKNRADSITYDFIELQNGGPFLTLPPLYGLAVSFNLTGAALITMSVWYQSITDHTPPAT